MDFTIHIDTANMSLSILYLNGSPVEISKIMFLKIAIVLANSPDPNEMPLYVAFHLGLHCLPKVPVNLYTYQNGYM